MNTKRSKQNLKSCATKRPRINKITPTDTIPIVRTNKHRCYVFCPVEHTSLTCVPGIGQKNKKLLHKANIPDLSTLYERWEIMNNPRQFQNWLVNDVGFTNYQASMTSCEYTWPVRGSNKRKRSSTEEDTEKLSTSKRNVQSDGEVKFITTSKIKSKPMRSDTQKELFKLELNNLPNSLPSGLQSVKEKQNSTEVQKKTTIKLTDLGSKPLNKSEMSSPSKLELNIVGLKSDEIEQTVALKGNKFDLLSTKSKPSDDTTSKIPIDKVLSLAIKVTTNNEYLKSTEQNLPKRCDSKTNILSQNTSEHEDLKISNRSHSSDELDSTTVSIKSHQDKRMPQNLVESDPKSNEQTKKELSESNMKENLKSIKNLSLTSALATMKAKDNNFSTKDSSSPVNTPKTLQTKNLNSKVSLIDSNGTSIISKDITESIISNLKENTAVAEQQLSPTELQSTEDNSVRKLSDEKQLDKTPKAENDESKGRQLKGTPTLDHRKSISSLKRSILSSPKSTPAVFPSKPLRFGATTPKLDERSSVLSKTFAGLSSTTGTVEEVASSQNDRFLSLQEGSRSSKNLVKTSKESIESGVAVQRTTEIIPSKIPLDDQPNLLKQLPTQSDIKSSPENNIRAAYTQILDIKPNKSGTETGEQTRSDSRPKIQDSLTRSQKSIIPDSISQKQSFSLSIFKVPIITACLLEPPSNTMNQMEKWTQPDVKSEKDVTQEFFPEMSATVQHVDSNKDKIHSDSMSISASTLELRTQIVKEEVNEILTAAAEVIQQTLRDTSILINDAQFKNLFQSPSNGMNNKSEDNKSKIPPSTQLDTVVESPITSQQQQQNLAPVKKKILSPKPKCIPLAERLAQVRTLKAQRERIGTTTESSRTITQSSRTHIPLINSMTFPVSHKPNEASSQQIPKSLNKPSNDCSSEKLSESYIVQSNTLQHEIKAILNRTKSSANLQTNQELTNYTSNKHVDIQSETKFRSQSPKNEENTPLTKTAIKEIYPSIEQETLSFEGDKSSKKSLPLRRVVENSQIAKPQEDGKTACQQDTKRKIEIQDTAALISRLEKNAVDASILKKRPQETITRSTESATQTASQFSPDKSLLDKTFPSDSQKIHKNAIDKPTKLINENKSVPSEKISLKDALDVTNLKSQKEVELIEDDINVKEMFSKAHQSLDLYQNSSNISYLKMKVFKTSIASDIRSFTSAVKNQAKQPIAAWKHNLKTIEPTLNEQLEKNQIGLDGRKFLSTATNALDDQKIQQQITNSSLADLKHFVPQPRMGSNEPIPSPYLLILMPIKAQTIPKPSVFSQDMPTSESLVTKMEISEVSKHNDSGKKRTDDEIVVQDGEQSLRRLGASVPLCNVITKENSNDVLIDFSGRISFKQKCFISILGNERKNDTNVDGTNTLYSSYSTTNKAVWCESGNLLDKTSVHPQYVKVQKLLIPQVEFHESEEQISNRDTNNSILETKFFVSESDNK
ncbi:unnamed protein product [Didymodactylos carnosus]|uniref:Uncharacterized protein n=1 Tax=Didymodactylos carnosus TaxID=1234261 RepID=A0A814CC93_9BILA|nr:unnamed protein product [Didymodactylos carnosus]CAF3717118.1 unnamed protein product [Didymodactylos carnosus]